MTGAFSLAVHALVYLNHKGESLSSEVLAENICTNPARVRKVMALLKRSGLVATKEGAQGGYTFTGDPASVTLRQVADAVDARLVEAGWRSGSQDMECLVASGMARIMDGIYSGLDAQCRETLEGITIADIDRQIFG
ncbi:MAG: Rrf2 family transcriptional regulator [Bacillota bacterium]|nr:Rrf2 family transcriptional regulator [Bacillota bacterium]